MEFKGRSVDFALRFRIKNILLQWHPDAHLLKKNEETAANNLCFNRMGKQQKILPEQSSMNM